MAKATLGMLMEPVERPQGMTASAQRSKPKTGRMSRFEVEIADNGGYIMTTYYHPHRTNGKGPEEYIKPVKMVHENRKSLLEALSKL